MMYDQILIRYGELSLKGRNRNLFVDKLRRNVQYVLKDFKNIKIHANRDRMYISLNGENWHSISEKLSKVFGIQSFSPVLKVDRDIENVKKQAVHLFNELNATGKKFKVSAKRADKTYEYDTNDLNQMIGGHLLKNINDLTVDVHHPDVDLKVEVRKNAIYLTCEIIKGAGGLPVGSSGKAMLMLSGGIDSPVAGYLAMKRGLLVEGVHFFSPPYTSERSKEKVLDLGKRLAEVSGMFKLYIVPFTEIQQHIIQHIPENYTMTVMRRVMLQITDAIRNREEGLAIITGESLGQVASQTLDSMHVINEVTNTPVIRPLVTMDKDDIIRIAREINTLDISNRPFEDCCTIFTPSQPKTKPKKDKVHQYEIRMNIEPFIEQAMEGVEIVEIHAGQDMNQEIESLF
ncbi:tRNA uracil 4-sulfurtransferase ThiI [Bacillus kwashiorkori]|uniref:tRNA uracil 4-sulfurtransferase ThiI n=1 Tax=Bacillus kwashiorkori TaxID=1522318 RepID=UPI0007818236|nr:tRNA uracil 4-sulfurtransferase ThiI [Bacillus kwashiorkori]